MLTIDRLRLSLPAGYEGRARRIAALVGDELARLPLAGSDVRLDRLTLPAVNVAPGASDRQVAGAVAGAVAAGLNSAAGGRKP
ncbi:MAG TPA: hypothetical protein VGX68_08700 [Thermoanaerobaculia bacterium]|jgi:hypothetical protein|nr:hypothetical protein [Thermoanaerobaculia bacterium]